MPEKPFGTVFLKRVSDVINGNCGFDFHTGEDVTVPSYFADNTELLDFIAVCGLSPSRYFN